MIWNKPILSIPEKQAIYTCSICHTQSHFMHFCVPKKHKSSYLCSLTCAGKFRELELEISGKRTKNNFCKKIKVVKFEKRIKNAFKKCINERVFLAKHAYGKSKG